MLCHRCQRHLRNDEGAECGSCESRFHLRCVSDARDLRDCGDRGDRGDRSYQWKCAVCEYSDMKIPLNNTFKDEHLLLNAINAISKKFDLVNKIQLPKLSNELTHLKSVADNIVKQNEQILQKVEGRDVKSKKAKKYLRSSSQNFRKRSVNLANLKSIEHNDNAPMLPTADKTLRFRPRRRSYVLNRMFHLLNRKLRKTLLPRKGL